jgi:hypothetical protein
MQIDVSDEEGFTVTSSHRLVDLYFTNSLYNVHKKNSLWRMQSVNLLASLQN